MPMTHRTHAKGHAIPIIIGNAIPHPWPVSLSDNIIESTESINTIQNKLATELPVNP